MRTKNLNGKKLIAALEATSQKKAWIFSGFLFATVKVASKSEDILYIIFNSSWNISLAYFHFFNLFDGLRNAGNFGCFFGWLRSIPGQAF